MFQPAPRRAPLARLVVCLLVLWTTGATASLSPYATESGKVSLVVNACGTISSRCPLTIRKPVSATTVRKAYAFFAGVPGTTSTDFTLNNQLLQASNPSTITYEDSWWHNQAEDVTAVAAAALDSLSGGSSYDFNVQEAYPLLGDGLILAVIFNDPSVPLVNSVTLLAGHQAQTGDTFTLTLASPHDPATKPLTLYLGISYSYVTPNNYGQFSTIDVGGTRLTSLAGGQDDADIISQGDGALITVGGVGDDRTNPADPWGLTPDGGARADDELYSLENLIPMGATSTTVFTANPSNDDNIFFGALLAENQVVTINPVLALTLAPANAVLTINTPQTMTATVVDAANGNVPVPSVAVTFTITGVAAQVETVPTDTLGQATITFVSGVAGTSIVQASVPQANNAISSITWTAPTNSPPSCDAASASRPTLWPPNHKLLPVGLTVPDVDGDVVTVTVTGVRSSDPVRQTGSGKTCPDATITPLQLRAERSGTVKPARMYRIDFTATDGKAACTGSVYVCVPHNMGVFCPDPKEFTFGVDATTC